MLVRQVIAEALGGRETGYFCRVDTHPPITALENLIDYGSLRGEAEYRKAVAELYTSTNGAFLTPSELFAPWYSYAVARWVLHCMEDSQLNIIEFGGGSGTFAVHFLDYLRSAAPQVYQNINYIDADVSQNLLKDATIRNERHEHRFQTRHIDACSFSANFFDQDTKIPTFVLAFELCDNLPHDKLRYTCTNNNFWKATHQAFVLDDEEYFEPIQDMWIQLAAEIFQPPTKSIFDHISTLLGRRRDHFDVFVPTGALQWLAGIRDTLPRHRLLLADFDSLPAPHLSSDLQRDIARNAPLVTARNSGNDLPSYLAAQDGSADIFLPLTLDSRRL